MAKGIKITKKTYLEEPRLKKKGKSITTQSRVKRLTPIAAEVTIYVFMILLLSAGTYWRNRIWNSEVELWADCVKKSSNKERPHNNLGNAFDHLGKYQEAVAQYTEALRINPNYAEAHYNLGNAFDHLGKYQEAVAQYTEALRINPIMRRPIATWEMLLIAWANIKRPLRNTPKPCGSTPMMRRPIATWEMFLIAWANIKRPLRNTPKPCASTQFCGGPLQPGNCIFYDW